MSPAVGWNSNFPQAVGEAVLRLAVQVAERALAPERQDRSRSPLWQRKAGEAIAVPVLKASSSFDFLNVYVTSPAIFGDT